MTKANGNDTGIQPRHRTALRQDVRDSIERVRFLRGLRDGNGGRRRKLKYGKVAIKHELEEEREWIRWARRALAESNPKRKGGVGWS